MYPLRNTFSKGERMKKMKVLHIELGGCEGCSISVLRAIPSLSKFIDIKSSYLEKEEFKINENERYDVCIITGPICLNHEEAISLVKLARKISEIIFAFGSCASLGGITLFCRGGQLPKPEHRIFQPINTVIKCDYSMPGCPPPPKALISFFNAIMKNIKPLLDLFKAVAKVRKLSGYDLLDDVVLTGLCIGCGACVLSCPTGALRLIEGRPELIVEKCIRCGTCYVRCPKASQILIRRYLK